MSCALALPNCLVNDWPVAGLKTNNLTWFRSVLSDTIKLTGQTPILSTLRLENIHQQFRIKAGNDSRYGTALRTQALLNVPAVEVEDS